MSTNPFRAGDTFTPITEKEKRLDMNASEYRITFTDKDMVFWRDDSDAVRYRSHATFLKDFRMVGAAARKFMDGSIVTMIGRHPGYGPHKDMTVGKQYRLFECTTTHVRYTDDVGDGCTVNRDEIVSMFALGLVVIPVEEPPTADQIELEKRTTDLDGRSQQELESGIVIALMASRGKDITAAQAKVILRVIDTMSEF